MKYVVSFFLVTLAFSVMARKGPKSLDDKIGQMIMMGIGERTCLAESDSLCKELTAGRLGGVVLFEKNLSKSNTADSLRRLIKELRRHSRYPLFVSIDEEGGKVHRLKEKYGFFPLPSAAYLGSLNNRDSTLYYNRKLAALLSGLGFNLNYAPSVDIAANAENTVIVKAERSFGTSPEIVAGQAALCIQAHLEQHVGTVLKHFPGHGSSSNDSHLGLVDVSNTWQPDELQPYDTLIRSGLCDAVMVAHVINRHWDSSMLPATLSYAVVTGMLRKQLRFSGIVFSDDMQMKAIADNYGLERAITLAVNAGVDMLMFANTIPDNAHRVKASQIHAIIKKLVLNKTISEQRIDESYRRIMTMKAKSP